MNAELFIYILSDLICRTIRVRFYFFFRKYLNQSVTYYRKIYVRIKSLSFVGIKC